MLVFKILRQLFIRIQGVDELPLVGDFEGILRMRKELRGLGWRQVYVRVYACVNPCHAEYGR